MNIYLLNAFSVLLYAFADYARRIFQQSTVPRPRKTESPGGASPALFSLLMLQEVLFLGTRTATVGVDTSRYVFAFENIFRYEFRYEKGFIIFTKLMRSITADGSVFLFVAAIICLLPIGVVIYRLSPMPYLSWYIFICMYYLSFVFSGMRQSIAMAMLFIAYYLLMNSKPIWAALVILVAGSFHASSLVFLILVILYKHRIGKKDVLILIPAYLFIFVARASIFKMILHVFYEDYELVETNAYTWMLLHLLLFFMLFVFNFYIPENRCMHLSLTSMSVGIGFILLISVGTNVLRVANYFNVFLILALPNAMRAIPVKIRLIALAAGVGILTVFYIIHLQKNPYSIIPYHSVLLGQECL